MSSPSSLPLSLPHFPPSLPPGNETDRGYKTGRDQEDALEGHEGLIVECLPGIGGVLLKVLEEMDGAISEISPGVNTSLSILPADPDTIKNSVFIFSQLV